MTNFILASLCTFSWISVSVCQFHTVSVRPAEDVTLMCSNFTKFVSNIFWFKMNSSPNTSCISSMLSADSNVFLYDGFHFSKYNVTSNTTNLFLKIKEVNFSDSGLYFCGPYAATVGATTVSAGFTATYLEVEDGYLIRQIKYQSDGLLNLSCVILGCVAVFLTVVIVALVVRTIQTGQTERKNPRPSENLDSHCLNYTALKSHPKTKNYARLSDEEELETDVLYAATRETHEK